MAGSAIPDPGVFGVDAAFPAALLALLLPALRRSDARRVGLAAAVIAVATTPFLAPGLPVLAGLLGPRRGGPEGGVMTSPTTTTPRSPAEEHSS